MYFVYLFLLILNISCSQASPDDLPWSHETYFKVSHLSKVAAKNIEKHKPEIALTAMDAGFFPEGQPEAIKLLGGVNDIAQCANVITQRIDDHLDPIKTKEWFEENLEVFTIPQDDPRLNLRGQRGVRAKCHFNDLTLLGIYSSHVYHFDWHGATLNNFKDLMDKRTQTPASDTQTRSTIEAGIYKRIEKPKRRQMAGPQDCIRYFENETSENKSQGHRYRFDLDYGPHSFVFAPFKKLSPMHLINTPEAGQEANVGYAVLKLKNRFPLLVVLTASRITAGTELLAGYVPDDQSLDRINGAAPDNHQALYALRANWSQINERLDTRLHIPIEPTAQENQLTDWKDLWLN